MYRKEQLLNRYKRTCESPLYTAPSIILLYTCHCGRQREEDPLRHPEAAAAAVKGIKVVHLYHPEAATATRANVCQVPFLRQIGLDRYSEE